MSFRLRYCANSCAAIAILLLAACTTAPVIAPGPAFELAARIAVRYQERAFSSALRWKQDAGGDDIWLTAPLGQTIAHLQADAGGATLTAADQREYRASSIESLTRSALGWALPLGGMRYWVLGLAAPGMALSAIERDSDNRLVSFRQDEFKVAVTYADPAARRPSRIEVAGAGAEIRLVIDNLSTPQP
jgi:outer membrane lipoprotein LolB